MREATREGGRVGRAGPAKIRNATHHAAQKGDLLGAFMVKPIWRADDKTRKCWTRLAAISVLSGLVLSFSFGFAPTQTALHFGRVSETHWGPTPHATRGISEPRHACFIFWEANVRGCGSSLLASMGRGGRDMDPCAPRR